MLVPQDIDENGMFDFFVQKQVKSGVRNKSDLWIILNNQALDAFFFKSTMVFSHDEDSQNLKEGDSSMLKDLYKDVFTSNSQVVKRFGDMAVGASFRFVATDIQDRKTVRIGS